ncbi:MULTISPECIES: DUF3558 domain-containing protein [Actinoalloteichus]|uniref:DUF3558 family protein n=1 Tax=Actinoalloteichus fjordicus TaxID=1612552 RepID=A0AAC9LIM0_9PSEU|nr:MULTISPECIES: DUF3558 domain-containing protein [Actinoalloteichus]APU17009.1 putative DUF3558 family protein [Actinoalloteichus fjordicus]APU23089.1 putative DUF3558 family protein [Actinoalloteichus sp. GBA129-24]
MAHRTHTTAVALLTAAALLTGCTTTSTGQATTTTEEQPTSGLPGSGGESSVPGAAELADRPQEIDLTGIDPCTLNTEDGLLEQGIDREPRPNRSADPHEPTCSLDHSTGPPYYGIQVKLKPGEGAEVLLAPNLNLDTEIIDIAGFPAVQNRRPTDMRGCFVDVSVAEGQTLSIQFDGGEEMGPPEYHCERATAAATMATETLVALHGN